MTELEVKQVKVDNWGIFFLQRLKHFFNRTDYCDLTLQFQDNAQLKVHRLVLSACTEYFELLERTCEMYEDCLVMPDDLQADVVVPIVNFMYTGQLEFRMDLLERLYQTSQIMNMPVLTKLLEAHRHQAAAAALKPPSLNYSSIKRSYSKSKDQTPKLKQTPQYSSSSNKRSHNKAFGNINPAHKEAIKKSMVSLIDKTNDKGSDMVLPSLTSQSYGPPSVARKVTLGEPRPTRYELPEELDTDNIFDNSFSSLSYSSQPLVVHPDSEKQYKPKRSGLFGEAHNSDTMDIIECTKVPKRENIFDDDPLEPLDTVFLPESQPHVSNQFFDQVVDQSGPKVTIETKDSKQASNIDHAKIISEVLKKYPHLVKSNKNIKLKILDTPSPAPSVYKSRSKKQQQMSPTFNHEEKHIKRPKSQADYTYESDVLDSKEAARLIALGAENVKGPWICLICGTPGKALHFGSYYKFRRHLIEVHKEKPIVNMCEYCGLKSLKRNYLLHHLLTKHGVVPPPTYNFPKCNSCDYVALTESLLVKHKLSHGHENRSFRCNVCVASFITSKELLLHIQATGHKYCDRKTNLQCVYCQKVFLRESNLFAHLKTYHKQVAKSDGIIEDSDEESQEEMKDIKCGIIKYEPQNFETENDDIEAQYQIRPDGNLELISKKSHTVNTMYKVSKKQTILNTGLRVPEEKPIQKVKTPVKTVPQTIQKDIYNEEIVTIGNNEFIMRDNQLIPRKKTTGTDFIIPEMISAESAGTEDSLSSDYTIQDAMTENTLQEQRMIMKKTGNTNQPIQIVVSNEEEYKALMNSNHSIIFDDGDTSKTLTVLSTPESAAAMNTTLDLENAQSTDMMIIQDDYPMNVSQAIPTDNSNIVVVYSHPVEQNKQYQIITSRDIDAQFVQTSAVISQNFQTVTTSSSVSDNQVIDTQTAESWQNDNPQDNQSNDEMQELHETTIEDHSEITSQVTPHVLSGLPEVSLTSIASQAVNEVTLTQDIADDSTPNVMPANNVVEDNENIDEPENVSSTSMDVDLSTNVVISSTVELPPESLPQDSTTVDSEGIGELQKPETKLPEHETQINENLLEEPSENVEVDHTSNDEEKIAQHSINSNEDKPVLEIEEYDTNEIENDATQDSAQVLPAGEENMTEKVPLEKIHNLTSEWSEEDDDNDIPDQDLENVNRQDQENMSVAEDSQEMEESIENIQQEMDKQVNEVSEQAISTETDSLSQIEDQPSSTLQAPQEKISSLLNDWEENDSQEENISANGTAHESAETEPTEVLQTETGDTPVEGEMEPKKVDKIQSLVSDWDDEDEDKE